MGLYFESSGSGRDIVLLHGWGMHAGVWNEVATRLAGQFRVHSVDLPGHGHSPACVPYTLDAIAARLTAACAPRATVCGWSLGGQLAMRWALSSPAQIERLVLIASTPRFVRGPGWDNGMEPAVFDAFARDFAHDPGGVLRRFVRLQAHGDTRARSVSRRLRACLPELAATDVASLAAALLILKDTDLSPDLPRITQRVLIMHGEFDAVVTPAAAAYLKRALPRSTLEIIAGAAHAPFIGRAQDVARRIAGFCHG